MYIEHISDVPLPRRAPQGCRLNLTLTLLPSTGGRHSRKRTRGSSTRTFNLKYMFPLNHVSSLR